MHYIAHRGNLNGSNPDRENDPQYVSEALSRGYEAEIDVWAIDEKIFSGHDEPQYEVDYTFLAHPRLWCHAKNLEALAVLEKLNTHYFWHQKDDVTLTSQNYVWTFPDVFLTPASICVMPEHSNYTKADLYGCKGICSDYIEKYYLEGKHNV